MAERRYWPSLDGVRGVAIAAVIAFHLGYLGGGFVGVDIFFVLSGFLITSLLLSEQAGSGAIRLGAFWARRARRLLPALLLLVFVLGVYALAGGPGVVPSQLRSPAVATLLYFANWQQVVAGHDYFAQYQAINPLMHTWSLAIEEQYYLVWPLLFVGFVFLGRRRSRRVLVTGTALLATGSAIWMGVAAHVLGPNRAYLGTDTRMWELLLGGLGAMALQAAGPLRRPTWWSAATVLGVGGVALGIALGGGPPDVDVGRGARRHRHLRARRRGRVRPPPRGPGGAPARRRPAALARSHQLLALPLALARHRAAHHVDTGLTGAALLSCRLAAMVGAACGQLFARRAAPASRRLERVVAPGPRPGRDPHRRGRGARRHGPTRRGVGGAGQPGPGNPRRPQHPSHHNPGRPRRGRPPILFGPGSSATASWTTAHPGSPPPSRRPATSASWPTARSADGASAPTRRGRPTFPASSPSTTPRS